MTEAGPGLLDSSFLASLDRLRLRTRRLHRGQRHGERRSRRTGRGLVFAGHRGYAVGDDLRHLDWDLLGRLDRPFLKLYEQETDLTVHLLLDVSRSMAFGAPSKYRAAARLAAALAFVALHGLDRVCVGLVDGTGLRVHGPTRGRGGLHGVLRFLDGASPQGPGGLGRAVRVHATAASTSGLTVVFSDFLDAQLPDALIAHGAAGHEVALVQILSAEELDPPFDGDLELLDAENGDPVEITLGPRERRAYLERLEAHRQRLRRFGARHGMDVVSLSADLPLEVALWGHLLRATFVAKR
jgi:uncharacterized protein (DUF58 family)